MPMPSRPLTRRCRRRPIRPSCATAKAALRRALEPPRLRLLTQFTTIPDGRQVPGRPARLPAEGATRRQAAGGAGGRSARPARGLVRHRLPRIAAHRLEQPGGAAGEAGRLRGGARDPLLARPEEPAGLRPPLLRLLPSAHARRAADLRRGGAGEGAGRQRAGAARREGAAARSATRRTPRSSIRSATASAGWRASASAIS